MPIGPLLRAKNDRILVAFNKAPVTSVEARDAIEGCYCVTRYQFMERHAAQVGLHDSEASLIAAMERRYRNTFARLGFDFEQPRAADLLQVLEFLDRELGWALIDPALHQHHDEVCRTVIAHMKIETEVEDPPTR